MDSMKNILEYVREGLVTVEQVDEIFSAITKLLAEMQKRQDFSIEEQNQAIQDFTYQIQTLAENYNTDSAETRKLVEDLAKELRSEIDNIVLEDGEDADEDEIVERVLDVVEDRLEELRDLIPEVKERTAEELRQLLGLSMDDIPGLPERLKEMNTDMRKLSNEMVNITPRIEIFDNGNKVGSVHRINFTGATVTNENGRISVAVTGSGGVSDGDKGDITVSGSGSTWTIDNDTIGLDELSATGTPSASTFLRGDNTWAVPAGSGDVSKVGTPVDNQVGVWTGDGTLEGDTALTFDTATDTLTAGIFAGAGGGLTTARIAGSTYSTVQHIQDLFHSAGWTSGGVISDNGDGTVAVTAGTGLIRATDSDVDVIYFTDFAAVNPLSLTDNDNNYIYVEYNAGAPQVVATTTERTDYNTNFLIGEVYRTGTSLHINPYVKIGVSDHASKMIRFNKEVMPYAHVSGGQISETGTRNLGITAGAFWEGLSKFTTGAFDSSGADRFTYYYYNGAAWVAVTSQSQIDNLQYNNIATGLATLTANRYGVHWVYIGAEATADVYVIYGQGDYTLAQAQDAMPPGTVPEIISSHGFLIGKIIIQKSASTFTQIESTYDMGFTPAIATEHNTLSGLQGGSAGEYYHLTSAQYTVVGNTSGTNTGDVTVADSSEIDFTLTGQQISASIVAGSIDESKLDASVNASLDLADSAVQPGDNISTLTNDAGYVTTSGYVPGGTDVALADGGTGASLTDPNADRIMFWDDSAGAVTWLTASTGLTISGTNMTVRSASTTQTGIAEASIASEVNTGTDTARYVSPDSLAGSYAGTKSISIYTVAAGTDVAVGDGAAYVVIPEAMNGMDLVRVHARVVTAGTTGTTDIQIHNVTDAVDILSTKLTIDSGETGSDTAATAAVINTANDSLATNDLIRIDVDAVSTTAPQGLIITLEARLP